MTNLYFRTVIQRDNPFLEILKGIAMMFERPPRLLLCVFLRKEMGERHFNIASASTLGFALLIPFLFYLLGAFYVWSRFFNWFWFVFVLAFIVMSYIHHRTQGFSLTSYDFDKFSLDEGKPILPWEKLLSKLGMNKKLTLIIIECIIEPLAIFLISLVFIILPFSRAVGILLLLSSIIYAISYIAAYWRARNQILKDNDERIMNEEMADVFMPDSEMPAIPENTRVKMPPILPNKKEHREALYNQIVVDSVAVL